MIRIKMNIMIIFIFLLAAAISGCATPGDGIRNLVGVSITEIEESRPSALTKTFDYDYETCYAKVEELLGKMPEISIYGQDEELIAVFWKNVNTTPVGIYITKVDASRTKVEVASPSTSGKEWVAKNIFEEKVLEPLRKQKYF